MRTSCFWSPELGDNIYCKYFGNTTFSGMAGLPKPVKLWELSVWHCERKWFHMCSLIFWVCFRTFYLDLISTELFFFCFLLIFLPLPDFPHPYLDWLPTANLYNTINGLKKTHTKTTWGHQSSVKRTEHIIMHNRHHKVLWSFLHQRVKNKTWRFSRGSLLLLTVSLFYYYGLLRLVLSTCVTLYICRYVEVSV